MPGPVGGLSSQQGHSSARVPPGYSHVHHREGLESVHASAWAHLIHEAKEALIGIRAATIAVLIRAQHESPACLYGLGLIGSHLRCQQLEVLHCSTAE